MKRKLIPLRLDPETDEQIRARAEQAGVSRQAYLQSLIDADLELRQRAEQVREREKVRRAIHGQEDAPKPRDRSAEEWRGRFTSPAAARLNELRQGRPEPVWTDEERRRSGYPSIARPSPLSRRQRLAMSFYPGQSRQSFREDDWPGGSPHIGPHVHIPSQD